MNETGHIKHVKLNLTNPKMGYEMDYNNLMILVGANGRGKTFIMKLNWCISTFVGVALIAPERIWKEAFQFIMDKSFDNQDISGKIDVEYENITASFELSDGKVLKADVVQKVKVTSFPKVLFMSKDTRTFEQIVRYIKTKDALGVKGEMFTVVDDSFSPVLNLYKLYDVVFIETMLKKLADGIELSDMVRKHLKEMNISKSFKSLYYDKSKKDIYYTLEDGTKGKASSLSAGEQSILNMFTAF